MCRRSRGLVIIQVRLFTAGLRTVSRLLLKCAPLSGSIVWKIKVLFSFLLSNGRQNGLVTSWFKGFLSRFPNFVQHQDAQEGSVGGTNAGWI